MKNKKLFIFCLIFVFAFCFTAVDRLIAANNNGNQQQNQEQNQEQNQTSTETENGEETNGDSSGRAKGQANAEQHRSTVANFVQGLLKVASSTEGGIGEQVRVVAREQNQSASTTIQAMETIQKRSKIMTFLFGTDYRNLGALRSEIVHTRNRIEQLNRIMADIENEGDRTELQNQIQTMEEEQERIQNFIQAEENQFSLFGWLIKLFQ